MNLLKKYMNDAVGISRVVGPFVALQWMFHSILKFPEVLRSRNLLSVDACMGQGPFRIHMGDRCRPFSIHGAEAFSGIREMYVRDSYLKGGVLSISDDAVIVDLGANMGNFVNLALAHGDKIKVFAVEPSLYSNHDLEKSVKNNKGFSERVKLIRAFLGEPGPVQAMILSNPSYEDAPWMSESDLIQATGLERIDFLKCDIEGGEFALLNSGSRLLAMARQIAIEIHQFSGDVEAFIVMLRQQGFQIKNIERAPDGSAVVLASR